MMEDLETLIKLFPVVALFGGIPFFIAQIFPSKKWLFGYGFIFSLAALYLYYNYVPRNFNEVDNGFAAVLGAFIVSIFWLVCLSTLIGVAIRTIILFFKKKEVAFRYRALVTLIGFSSIFLLSMTPYLISALEWREPTKACIHDPLTLHMASLTFRVNPAPELYFSKDDGKGDTNENITNTYQFRSVKSFRRFCKDYKNGRKKAQATQFSFLFRNLPTTYQESPSYIDSSNHMNFQTLPIYRDLCTNKKAYWPRDLCTKDHGGLPQDLYIYNSEKYNARMIGSKGSVYAYIQSIKSDLTDESDLDGFLYDGQRYYYWISTDIKTPDGNSLSMKCDKKADHKLWCNTEYVLKEPVHVRYNYWVDIQDPFIGANRIYDKVNSFVDKIRAKD